MLNLYFYREDLDSIIEISLWPGIHDPTSNLDSKVCSILILINTYTDILIIYIYIYILINDYYDYLYYKITILITLKFL